MHEIPVLRPTLPRADEIVPWLHRIDESHWYSNFGPLETELREAFAALVGVTPQNIALFSSGTAALSVALRASRAAAAGPCLVPSWTHVGTLTAIYAAGMTPHLMDCDERTWSLTIEAVREMVPAPAAVLAVAPFGADFDYSAWDRLASETGVPVVIDAAAGFDRVVAHGSEIPWGRTPVMVSLHATKTFGVGEGGLLISADKKLILDTQVLSNFGIRGHELNDEPFSNCKLSEYVAAIGLAGLHGNWPRTRARLVSNADRYVSALLPLGVRFAPGFGGRFVSSKCMISVPGLTAEFLERELMRGGIETKRWWRRGLHRLSAAAQTPMSPLPVTNRLAETFLGIPYFADLKDGEIERVIEMVGEIGTRAARMRELA